MREQGEPTDRDRAEPPAGPDAVLGSDVLFRGWLDLLMLQLRINGHDESRPLVRHPSGAAVLPYDPDRRVAITVTQTRAAPLFLRSPPLEEAIAGVAEETDLAETARREAWEEGGLRLARLDRVGAVWMDPNSSTEQVHLFLAEYRVGDRVAAGGGLAAENERVVVREWPLAELWDAVVGAPLADAKTLLLLQALRLRRPALFTATGDPVAIVGGS
ncbi:MAG TPA: NUDIX domain-containing protein [Sphingomonas sp.]|jgi:nudix-type nucleoside diphosphatase (YffH/AdpP family)|uniref:NUDIX domain-containing protein n=1 Tax=Sphingomonas sp. TaxID=28214 RepID=UPI002EDA0EA7